MRLLKVDLITIAREWDSADVRGTFWRLYLNTRNGAHVTANGAIFAIEPGCLNIIPPWVRFSCHCDRPVEHFYIHADIIGVPGMLVRETLPGPFRLSADSALQHQFAGLRQCLRDSGHLDLPGRLNLKGAVACALAEMIESLPAPGREAWERLLHDPLVVAPALELMARRLASPPDNGELAAACHLSPDHFARRFRTLVGQTPHQYVLEQRLSRAAQLLVFTTQSIEAIAEETGFTNRYHFTRVFTSHLGVPPATYRRTTRV